MILSIKKILFLNKKESTYSRTRQTHLTRMIFSNRRYFTKQTFEIRNSSLALDKKNLFEQIEYEIPFDIIHNKMKIQTVINNNLIFTGIFIFVFGLLFIFGTKDELTFIFASLGLMCILIAFINRKRVITISTYDGNGIELYFTKSNKQAVVHFAKDIIKASDNYLHKKFTKIDRSLPIEPQIENLQFLLNREIISEESFQDLKNQLYGKDNLTAIGFGQK